MAYDPRLEDGLIFNCRSTERNMVDGAHRNQDEITDVFFLHGRIHGRWRWKEYDSYDGLNPNPKP